jgi:group I intron endonuclease
MDMIIYKITNKINGKLYIGQTVQKIRDRWSDHARPYRGKHKALSAVSMAIQKYGKENFIVEQIDSAGTLETLNLLEIHYIKKFNSLSPNGYNFEEGGENKRCHPETKAKISATLKGRPIKNRMNGAPKGRPVSEERKAQISKTLTGKPQPWKYKAIIVIETGSIFKSINEAAKVLKINRTIISLHLKTGQTHNKSGLTFQFCNNPNKGTTK